MVQIDIPPKHGAAVELSTDEELSVVDPEGGQVADLVVFDPTDERLRSSAKYTMRQAGGLRITTGDHLYSTEGTPMLEIVADDCGVHDLLYAPCNHWILDGYDQPGSRGCRENLSEALSKWDVPEHLIQEPLNVFMRTVITDSDDVNILEPITEPGDEITFRAEDNVVVAVSACAAETTTNDGTPGPISLRAPDGAQYNTNF